MAPPEHLTPPPNERTRGVFFATRLSAFLLSSFATQLPLKRPAKCVMNGSDLIAVFGEYDEHGLSDSPIRRESSSDYWETSLSGHLPCNMGGPSSVADLASCKRKCSTLERNFDELKRSLTDMNYMFNQRSIFFEELFRLSEDRNRRTLAAIRQSHVTDLARLERTLLDVSRPSGTNRPESLESWEIPRAQSPRFEYWREDALVAGRDRSHLDSTTVPRTGFSFTNEGHLGSPLSLQEPNNYGTPRVQPNVVRWGRGVQEISSENGVFFEAPLSSDPELARSISRIMTHTYEDGTFWFFTFLLPRLYRKFDCATLVSVCREKVMTYAVVHHLPVLIARVENARESANRYARGPSVF